MVINKILVKLNGIPVNNAKVLIGDLFTDWRETDEDGNVAYQVGDSYHAVLPIAIRGSGAGRDVIIIKVIEAGVDIEVKISKTVEM